MTGGSMALSVWAFVAPWAFVTLWAFVVLSSFVLTPLGWGRGRGTRWGVEATGWRVWPRAVRRGWRVWVRAVRTARAVWGGRGRPPRWRGWGLLGASVFLLSTRRESIEGVTARRCVVVITRGVQAGTASTVLILRGVVWVAVLRVSLRTAAVLGGLLRVGLFGRIALGVRRVNGWGWGVDAVPEPLSSLSSRAIVGQVVIVKMKAQGGRRQLANGRFGGRQRWGGPAIIAEGCLANRTGHLLEKQWTEEKHRGASSPQWQRQDQKISKDHKQLNITVALLGNLATQHAADSHVPTTHAQPRPPNSKNPDTACSTWLPLTFI